MPISERDRRDAYTGLEQALGEDVANTIMQLLPNQPADQLVTRADMHAFGAEIRGEMAGVRGEAAGLRGEMAELRGEMAELRADMIDRFATAKVETQRLIAAGMAHHRNRRLGQTHTSSIVRS